MLKLPALTLTALLAVAGCGGAKAIPADAQTAVVSLDRIDCADCGEQIVADLRERPGIYSASFDKQKAEVRVVASASFDVLTAVKQLAAHEGFQAILGAGQGHYLDGPAFPPTADFKVITRGGAQVPEIATLPVKGKFTVIDFSATWCRPCRQIDEHMAAVLGARSDIAYRKLEIGDWDTPLAQRYLKGVAQLPYVIVYDAAGARVKEIVGVDLASLDAALAVRGAGAQPQ
ncbi:MAG: thioredoxin family protein [Byssovorax sp.]